MLAIAAMLSEQISTALIVQLIPCSKEEFYQFLEQSLRRCREIVTETQDLAGLYKVDITSLCFFFKSR